MRHLLHGGFYLIGNVGDDLHGLAQVVAAALLGDNLLVDSARGQVVVARQASVGKALIMPQVEISFRAIVGDEDLAMLKWRHGAGIHVEIGVELLQVDPEAAAFQ